MLMVMCMAALCAVAMFRTVLMQVLANHTMIMNIFFAMCMSMMRFFSMAMLIFFLQNYIKNTGIEPAFFSPSDPDLISF